MPVRDSDRCSTRKPWNYDSGKAKRLFPPRRTVPKVRWHNKGQRPVRYWTVNGSVCIRRRVYWNRQHGAVTPVDQWLGLSQRYSPGVRELCCREASRSSFRRAAEDLDRVGQIRLSAETLRGLVEAEGQRALQQQRRGTVGPDWTAADCIRPSPGDSCVITGADGVKVPLVTAAEKAKRRRRRRRGPHARRLARGSDQRYKEFKIVTFYDPSHEHQYAVGTSGNHRVAGRLMRREARRLHLDRAAVAYSVSDGADWIYRQYQIHLPLLAANILDYYHFRDYVIKTSAAVFGEGTDAARRWREQVCGVALEQGPVETLALLATRRRSLRAPGKRKALADLIGYMSRRLAMLAYPQFQAAAYEIGSGPTEAFCKTLTARLKGSGMRWDKPHAEGLMALASIRSSHLWDTYWRIQRQAA